MRRFLVVFLLAACGDEPAEPPRAPPFKDISDYEDSANHVSKEIGIAASSPNGAEHFGIFMPRVYLNLPALAVGRHFDAAVVHESTHTVQPPRKGATLLDLAVHEGVATYVSLALVDGLSDHDAMFWSKKMGYIRLKF